MPEDAVVLVGQKPTMNYVLATTMPLNEGRVVILKARGRCISKAVDIAEITRRRFFQDASIRSIEIGTEEGKSSMDGRPRNVSTIEITVAPTKAPVEKKAEKPTKKPSEKATE
ncbi:MAG: DNA-binding protein Alba [Nitrososphaeria archaeon]